MVKNVYVPNRGDVVWVDFNPTRGHEQSKVRPALVLSPKAYNKKTGLLIACPITSQVKGYAFEVAVQEKKIVGVVLTDQVRSLDWRERRVAFIQKCSHATLESVVAHIQILLTEDE